MEGKSVIYCGLLIFIISRGFISCPEGFSIDHHQRNSPIQYNNLAIHEPCKYKRHVSVSAVSAKLEAQTIKFNT